MKKKNLVPLAALFFTLCIPATAYAGDINSAEQGILDAIAGTQEYNGEYYRVTDGYRAKVSDYLNRDDIDLGQQEANDYLFQFYRNIPTGIASGYMEKVEPPGEAGDPTGGDKDTDSGTGNTAGAGDSKGTGTDADGNAGAGTDTGSGNGASTESGTAAGNGAGSGAGAGNAAGTAAEAVFGTDPEGDGPIVDNTTGSTAEGAVEYMVLPMDEQTMYVQGIEALSVHEEAYKDSPVIGEVKEGEPVKVTGGASTGWAQIAFGEKTGYVSAAYLRTQGYMDKKEAEKKAAEEAEQKAQEEARKAEEEKKAAEEVERAKEADQDRQEEKAGETGQTGEEAETEDAAQQAKDYSDAKPVKKSINLGMAALVIALVCAAILGEVLFYHKDKSRSGKR